VRKTRVVVGFGEGVELDRKPPLLRALEQVLRRESGEQLEVFMEEMRDQNRLRRLTTTTG
jgi:hypothetical protein